MKDLQASNITASPWANTRLVKAADSAEINFLESVVMVKVWVRVITQRVATSKASSSTMSAQKVSSWTWNILGVLQICPCNMMREENFEKKFVDFKLLQIDYSGFQCSACFPQNSFSHQLIQKLRLFCDKAVKSAHQLSSCRSFDTISDGQVQELISEATTGKWSVNNGQSRL